MSVINTTEWLETSPDQYEICEKLTPYFSKMNARDISNYLHSFGMYKRSPASQDWIDVIKDKRLLHFINDEKKKLKSEWNGPSVPIFVFPVDVYNRKIEMEYRGRSGLAFHDKLFLFLSQDVKKEDIKSLLTHEYHHVCRLASITKPEKDFTIIDTMVMEGLAENAVREKLGEEAVAEWTKLYHPHQCDRFLERIILPQKKTTRQDPKFTQLMFGTGFYPKMLGYSVGYHLVKNYMEKTNKGTKALLGMEAEDFIQ
ncbi:DUF2268 domain-containing protein [Metabacillus sp. B2-18]|uniref:DUF2268 domain-containing protein n=1 Tax=Metabacillus sp. B2-18 TaxID=2897333 RepID=UPI001E431AF5|nr:DUF2268 domain-containing protein [Metabacillus sp. B2-18]UGB31796.1 DUF2268 domain-containing protein [Metabacillus sp. B2-18]